MGMTKEDAGDDMRRVAVDNLIEQICGIWQGVRPVPTAEHVADDPNALTRILCGLQFLNQEAEGAGDIGIRAVDVVEDIGPAQY